MKKILLSLRKTLARLFLLFAWLLVGLDEISAFLEIDGELCFGEGNIDETAQSLFVEKRLE